MRRYRAKFLLGQLICEIPKNARNTFKDGVSVFFPKTKFLMSMLENLSTKIVDNAVLNVIAIHIHVCSSKGKIIFS